MELPLSQKVASYLDISDASRHPSHLEVATHPRLVGDNLLVLFHWPAPKIGRTMLHGALPIHGQREARETLKTNSIWSASVPAGMVSSLFRSSLDKRRQATDTQQQAHTHTKRNNGMLAFTYDASCQGGTENSKNDPKRSRKCLSPVRLISNTMSKLFFSQRNTAGMATLTSWVTWPNMAGHEASLTIYHLALLFL